MRIVLLTKRYILAFLFLILIWKVNATHIVGGEISYVQNPGNQYVVTLEIYRDCSSATNANFDDPANLMIYKADGTYYTNILMNIAVRNFMPSTINNPCITTPELCVEYAMYTTTVTLPPISGGYNLVYQRCCRNGTILNLIQPGSIGSTYMEHIPGSNEVAFNNSPKFNSIPPKFICKGIPIEFDHSATDADGDVLVYSLCDPFNGLDACCPVLTTGINSGGGPFCSSPGSPCPSIGQPPPYPTVPFLPPYNGSYPLSSNPAISIDPQTGFLNGIPDIVGQWVVGVCVQEFRNGVLIGTHKRDFQFNVVQCTVASSAAIASQTIYCEGFQVDFHNLSFSNIAGGITYSWNFGDTTTLADTSHLFEPSYVYPDTGRYSVNLIVNEGKPCSDSTTVEFFIYPPLDPDFTIVSPNVCFNTNSFNFAATGVFAPYATFDWDFGSSANPSTSVNANQNNVHFNQSGSIPVTLTVTQSICSEDVTKSVLVYNPQAQIASQTDLCGGFEVNFQNMSTPSIGTPLYFWNFGIPNTLADTSHLFEPAYVYIDSGKYEITLIMTEGPCTDTSGVDFYIYPPLNPDFSYTYSTACINDNSFDFNGGGIFSPITTFAWNFGPNANPLSSTSLNQNNVQFTGEGPFLVTLTMTQAVCVKDITQTINVYPEPQAYFSPFLVDGCQPQTVVFTDSSLSANALSYLWVFGDGDSSILPNPIHVYEDLGTFNVSLTVITSDGCIDTSMFTVQNMVIVKPSPRAGFIVYPYETTVYEPVFHFVDTSFQTVAVEMQMGDGFVYNYFPDSHFYEEFGEYEITQVAFGSNGCPDTMKQKVKVIPEHLFWIPNAFTPNGDYINGVFKPELMGVVDYSFYVYDRWGEKIFETHDTKTGWDGTYKGNKCQQDVYVYLIRYKDVVEEDEHQRTGTFTLFR